MKKDLETMTVSLHGEKVSLLVSNGFLDNLSERTRWKNRAHSHHVYEVHLLVRGESRLNVEGQTLTIKEGQAVLFAPGQFHEFHAAANEFERLSFYFMPDKKAQAMRAVLQSKVKGFQLFQATEEMLLIGRTMPQYWTESMPYRQEKRTAQLTSIFIDICWELGLVTKEPWDANTGSSRMLLCDDFFADTAGRTAKQLADILQMSERQLNRCLMEIYGMSFQQKLVQSRMERASLLLRTTAKTVSQIAEEVGYDAESGLYKEFRKRFGMTPQQYRKQQQKPARSGHKV